ncbi:MAG: endonuclease/exonuclease/phosphatase family protein [Acidobacteriota bacterium]
MTSQQEHPRPSASAGRAIDELARVGLTALVVVCGLQTLRALLPLLIFVLRDRFGWSAVGVGLVALGVFATGFLAAPLRRILGGERYLLLTAGGLAASRLAYQLWTGDPMADLGLVILATVAFFLALPALLAMPSGGSLVCLLGWLLGLLVDTALHGAFGTLDLSWRFDGLSQGVTGALVVLLMVCLLRSRHHQVIVGTDTVVPLASARTWAWAAIGPWLFLQLLILANVARLSALTGWSTSGAALWVVGAQGLGLGVAAGLAVGRWVGPGLARWAAATLVAAVAFAWPQGLAAAGLLLVGQLASGVLLAPLVTGLRASRGGFGRRASAYALGLLALAVLFFLYYGSVDIALPFSPNTLPPVAAIGVGVASLAAARAGVGKPPAWPRSAWRALAVLAGLVLLVPAARLAVEPPLPQPSSAGLPLRVMTFNIHCGIDPWGHLGLEAIAQAIEAEAPDVVALQEVSRGWVANGSVDAVAWLARRLAMPYVFDGTADPLWGNVILSRRPILDWRIHPLPTEELLIRRGLLAARIELEGAEPIELIVTHFHHPRTGGAVRELQSRALLDFWQERERTVIVGDFNARPGEPEIELLRRAGLREVIDLAAILPGYTHSALRPRQRIDYIWISPDLAASAVAVPAVTASDHLPVVATVTEARIPHDPHEPRP